MDTTEKMTIRIERRIHRPTGLISAFSDDLKGLLVFGDTDSEIDKKLPGAIKEMLEAMGRNVVSVTAEDPPGWSNMSRKDMQVRLAEAV
jgi:hypothetical protein